MTRPPANVLALPLEERAEMALKVAVEKVIVEHARRGLPMYILAQRHSGGTLSPAAPGGSGTFTSGVNKKSSFCLSVSGCRSTRRINPNGSRLGSWYHRSPDSETIHASGSFPARHARTRSNATILRNHANRLSSSRLCWEAVPPNHGEMSLPPYIS
jgi:hypothetical protein